MTDLTEFRRVCEGRTRGWPSSPGWGESEDDGFWVIGAVGPNHTFLSGDKWEHDFERPQVSNTEAEARKAAACDQEFARFFDAHADAILAELTALRAVAEEADHIAIYDSGWPRLKEALAAWRSLPAGGGNE